MSIMEKYDKERGIDGTYNILTDPNDISINTQKRSIDNILTDPAAIAIEDQKRQEAKKAKENAKYKNEIEDIQQGLKLEIINDSLIQESNAKQMSNRDEQLETNKPKTNNSEEHDDR